MQVVHAVLQIFDAFGLFLDGRKELVSRLEAIVNCQWPSDVFRVVLLQVLLVLVSLALLTRNYSLWVDPWSGSRLIVADIDVFFG